MNTAWIGVDLDGTLATYSGWVSHTHIGDPVPAMVARVTRWLSEGRLVKIFTARVATSDEQERSEVLDAIYAWSLKHIGVVLQVTNVKDMAMVELYDDRAVQVVPNTGELVGQSTRGL